MNYSCLQSQVFQEGLYKLVPLRHGDIYLIMQWRNEQINVLRQKNPLRAEEQEKYFKEVIEPSFTQQQPDLILFSYLLGKDCIGYGGLVHIDWNQKKAEVSFLMATERTKLYENEFVTFLTLLKQVAFQDLPFNELFTETYEIRPEHIKILEEQGFAFEKRVKNHARPDSVFHICRRGHG
jgi:hypothetical protein